MNIFGFNSKKEPSKEGEVGIAILDSSKYSPAITKVHEEFMEAGEKLYQEALSIINRNASTAEKAQRLKSLGFIATPEVINYQSVEITKELAALIKSYKIKYPLYKFITENQVREICKKYGLVLGEVSNYTGFVPDKNLKEIEKFKINSLDIPDVETTTGRFFNSSLIRSEWFKDGKWQYITFTSGEVNLKTPGYTPETYEQFRYMLERAVLRICAPAKDFKMSTREKIVDHKIVQVPDPVVIQPVFGGYLIVTAWGDEASDPIVVNHKNN